MKMAIVANHDLNPADFARHLARLLAVRLTISDVFLRAPISGPPGEPEKAVALLCDGFSIPVTWMRPQPGHGSLGTIQRDQSMVDDADYVIAYFTAARAMDDDSGTTRLVKMAINSDTPIEAFAVTEDEIVDLGSIGVPA